MTLQQTVDAITPVDPAWLATAEAWQLNLTKPPRSLARLEDLGNQLCAIAGACPPPVPLPALVTVFGADHGVHAQGVSPWPQEVSAQMAANIAAGGAAISVLSRVAGADLVVHDVGIADEVPGGGVTVHHIREGGTSDLSVGAAMTREEALAALEYGIQVANEAVDAGYACLVPGEIGIANTTPSAALVAAFTGASPAEVTGRGAGSDDARVAHKVSVIEAGLAANGVTKESAAADPVGALAAVGGFEHAAIAGLILGAAARKVPVVLDGVIVCSAALAAQAIAPASTDVMISGHQGAEPGIATALATLGLEPILSLGLCLGEGSGAATALPVLVSAAKLMNEMATFGSAGVTEDHE